MHRLCALSCICADVSCSARREDIWALEDKVRAAKWARFPTEQVSIPSNAIIKCVDAADGFQCVLDGL
jgi:hypothetical protein